MQKKLRLLITEKCNRDCKMCCNKDWDLKNLPVCLSYKNYDEIIITGGEPTLFPSELIHLLSTIKKENKQANIILYTANVTNVNYMLFILQRLHGITVTLHEQQDYRKFKDFIHYYGDVIRTSYIFPRVNIFSNVKVNKWDGCFLGWTVKDNLKWVKNCPLPKDEVFMRIKNLLI